MRRFLTRSAIFSGVALVVFVSALYLTSSAKSFLIRSGNLLDLDDTCTTLVLGDSHSECALDDDIIPHTVNMSQNADCYLYCYVKLRGLLHSNAEIDTVVLSYSYHNLARSQDNWLLEGDALASKINRYYYFMTAGEIIRLLRFNPGAVFGVTTTVFKTSIESLIEYARGGFTLDYLNIGKFLFLERDRLDEALRRLAEEPEKPEQYSEFQKEYLIKIRDFCRENGKTLVLIQTPKHPALREKHAVLKNEYYRFYREELGGAVLLDYGEFELPDSCFGDANHLNFRGAGVFSRHIKHHGFGRTVL